MAGIGSLLLAFVIVAIVGMPALGWAYNTTIERATKTSGCRYGGKDYPPGSKLPSFDPCEPCECSQSGRVACHRMACKIKCPPAFQYLEPKNGECCGSCSDYCVVDGKKYYPGDRIPDPDPCKHCNCHERYGQMCYTSQCTAGLRCANFQAPIRDPNVCCPYCPKEEQPDERAIYERN